MKSNIASQFVRTIFLLILAAVAVGCRPPLAATAQPAAPATRIAASPAPTLTPTRLSQYLTPIDPPATTGITPPVVAIASSWKLYENAVAGFTLNYPPDWIVVEQPDRNLVTFYPPGADPQLPGALVSFNFIASRPYTGQPALQKVTSPQPIDVGGIQGIRYENSKFAVPTYSTFLELPYRGGTLLVSATKGPQQNLVPQLEEMLKTFNQPLQLSALLPEPTATSAPVSPSGAFVRDHFDRDLGWDLWHDKNSFTEISEGVFRFGVTTPGMVVWTHNAAYQASNFDLQVSINLPVSAQVYSCGVTIRASARGDYLVGINNARQYEIIRRVRNSEGDLISTPLANWVATPHLPTSGWVELEVITVGEEIDLLINGKIVDRKFDSALREGKTGFYVSTYGGGNQAIVEFDNLNITGD